MQIIIHHPETPEKQALFRRCTLRLYREHVARYIDSLPCSPEQKGKLIDAVAKTILHRGPKAPPR